MRAAVTVLALCLAPAALAQEAWVPLEPSEPGLQSWLAAAPGALFGECFDPAQDRFRVCRSDDGGATSSWIDAGLPPLDANRVLYENGRLAVVFLDEETYRNGPVYVSSDRGETWSGGGVAADAFVDDFDVVGDTLVLATDPATDDNDARVLWSVDDGATWNAAIVTTFPGDGEAPVLCFTRSLFRTLGSLYAATGCGLYRATDGVEAWTFIDEGDLDIGEARFSLWGSASDGDAAYVAPSVFGGGAFTDVYGRIGEGTWRRLGLYDALGLDTWPPPDSDGLLAVGDTVVVAMVGAGVALSPDRGATWRAVNEGLVTQPDGSISANGLLWDGSTIYVSSFDGEQFRPYRLSQAVAAADDRPRPSSPVRVGPNPVRSRLTVEAGTPDALVRLLDVTGRTVRTGRGASVGLDVSALAPGPYLVTVEAEGERHVRRATVVH